MKKSIAAVFAALALVLSAAPAIASDAPEGPGSVGIITEPLPYPQWKTDSDHYGDADSCENPGLRYPDACAVFPDSGLVTVNYLVVYIARLHEDYINALALAERKQERIERLKAKVRSLR